MKREQVLEKLKSAQSEIAKIKVKEAFVYETADTYVPGVGCINDLTKMEELVKAHAAISKTKSDLTESAKELEIELSNEEFEFQGIKISNWVKDIKNRKDELNQEAKLEKLLKAETVLKKHLSDDDKFTIEMDGISDVLDLI